MSFGAEDDDPFQHTRMSFWDHIEELRLHMFRAIAGFLIALVVGLFVGKPMVRFIAAPVEDALTRFYEKRLERYRDEIAGGLFKIGDLNKPKDIMFTLTPEQRQQWATAFGIKGPLPNPEEPAELHLNIKPIDWAMAQAQATQRLTRPPTLATLSATEAFVVYFKVSIYCGIVLASPWIFYQLWSFVAAGLYPHEKKLVNVYLPVSIGLFLAGVALCEFVVLPTTLDYLLGFNSWMDLEPDLRLNEWLSFAIMMPLVFGIAFQLPLVMLFLYRLGIVDVSLYRRQRRIAYFVIAALYLVIGASPDAFSMLMLTVPLWMLYELGIWLCVWSPRPVVEEDEPEPGEMVEV